MFRYAIPEIFCVSETSTISAAGRSFRIIAVSITPEARPDL